MTRLGVPGLNGRGGGPIAGTLPGHYLPKFCSPEPGLYFVSHGGRGTRSWLMRFLPGHGVGGMVVMSAKITA